MPRTGRQGEHVAGIVKMQIFGATGRNEILQHSRLFRYERFDFHKVRGIELLADVVCHCAKMKRARNALSSSVDQKRLFEAQEKFLRTEEKKPFDAKSLKLLKLMKKVLMLKGIFRKAH